MNKTLDLIEKVKPCLRGVGEEGRVFPKARRVEIVFLVEAANYLLLRTEGPGYINAVTLPESRLEVPVILPEKLQAVTRRKMLHLLRDYKDHAANEVKKFVEEAANLGFVKAEEHLKNGWNCTIQPPIAETGEKATDLGMDGYCPACTLFGAALTGNQIKDLERMSIGIKTRVHFDPAFATRRGIVPATHNKVTESLLSTTGQALYSEVHVEPGTVFVGRAVLTEVTEPELTAFLYTLAQIEEIGGRAGVYGTIRVHLLGVRCGKHSATTALELAEELAKEGKTTITEAENHLKKKLEKLDFQPVDGREILSTVEHSKPDGLFQRLWDSSIDYARQVIEWIHSLRTPLKDAGKEKRKKSRQA